MLMIPSWYSNTSSDMLSFFEWMNKQHPSITFTKEEEQDNKLSFLNVLLTRTTDGSIVLQPYGPHKRRVYLCLPYVGELATNKFARQTRWLIAKIAPCVELRLVFRAAQKLSCLTRLKSKLNVLSRSGVVYQISCSQCEAFYVGKTKRRLEQRVQEHSQQGYSFPVQAFL